MGNSYQICMKYVNKCIKYVIMIDCDIIMYIHGHGTVLNYNNNYMIAM